MSDHIECAHCHSDYAGHFERVQVFMRDSEDAEATIFEWTRRGGIRIHRGSAPNRRDTIRVFAKCEECEELTLVEIEEHKGHLAFMVGTPEQFPPAVHYCPVHGRVPEDARPLSAADRLEAEFRLEAELNARKPG